MIEEKKDDIQAKKWCISLLCINLIILILMGAFIYSYDPFCYFRIPEDRIIVNNYRFINPGITRNADYDTVIIGSSMTQNFVMDSFREKLNMNPIKLSVGGMSIEGTELTYSQVKQVGSAKNIIFCIDLPSLNKEEDELSTYATYLYDDISMNDYKYLLGYETWMRLLPLNMVFDLLDNNGAQIPKFYATKNIDTIGEWHNDFTFSSDILKNNYTNRKNNLSSQNLDRIEDRMLDNSNKLIKSITKDVDDKNIIIFFPPYSALYWYEARENGYIDEFQTIKKYIVSELEEYDDIKIYDFQSIDEITNLDNYKDTTHYSQAINELMVDYMSEGKYLVKSENIDESIMKLNEKVDIFEKQNLDWLK